MMEEKLKYLSTSFNQIKLFPPSAEEIQQPSGFINLEYVICRLYKNYRALLCLEFSLLLQTPKHSKNNNKLTNFNNIRDKKQSIWNLQISFCIVKS